GLTLEEAERRRRIYGPNKLDSVKPPSWYMLLFQAIVHPFNILLLVLGAISIATGDKKTFGMMLAMIALSAGMRYYQEMRSTVAVARLRDMIKATTKVLRTRTPSSKVDGDFKDQGLHLEEVVPGDVVVLSAGSSVPADIRLIESRDLLISQSALTGEIEVVTDTDVDATTGDATAAPSDSSTGLLDHPNVVIMGTNVVSGYGRGIVISTGNQTYMSSIAASLARQQPVNAFQLGIRRVSLILSGFMLVMVPIVIVLNGVTTKAWRDAALFGIAVAVGLVPEMLPMILNANLALGAVQLVKRKTIVKRLDAIQNLGAMDVVCSDKTGTLTQDQVDLAAIRDAQLTERKVGDILHLAFINAAMQSGMRNALDDAIIRAADERALLYNKVDEIPFDFTRRRVSIALQHKHKSAGNNRTGSSLMLVCKGALEDTLAQCSFIASSGYTIYDTAQPTAPLADETRAAILEHSHNLNADGMRVLAIATKVLHSAVDDPITTDPGLKISDESDMVFHGMVAFLDPPKESAAPAIQDFAKLGVAIKVLTGDSLTIAQRVCRDVGIDTTVMVTGPQLEAMKRGEFAEAVRSATVLAKLTPTQKLEVVKELQAQGRTVGFLGDGINDALALRGADVGISVETGTAIAKDAADVILTEKSLAVISWAIRRGRTTHGNTIKYIKMTASSNFGNVFSMLVAAAWLPFTPMTAMQLLAQNLLYDISQLAIPWDHMDEEYLLKPRAWDAGSIVRFMACLGPTSSVFDISTFLLMWFYYGVRTEQDAPILRSSWFTLGFVTQTIIVHIIRTPKIPFVQSRASWQVCVMSLVILAIGISLPYTPLGKDGLEMVHPPQTFYGFFVLFVFLYMVLAQIVKYIYVRRFKEWL
ncbi:transmembrane protein, partial [Ramicandelaber brevisporus]